MVVWWPWPEDVLTMREQTFWQKSGVQRLLWPKPRFVSRDEHRTAAALCLARRSHTQLAVGCFYNVHPQPHARASAWWHSLNGARGRWDASCLSQPAPHRSSSEQLHLQEGAGLDR